MINQLEILYETSDMLAIDKPSGMVVNKSQTVKNEETVQDLISDRIQLNNDNDVESEFLKRGGVVHRLDRETSGVLLIAKNSTTFDYLQSLFRERKIEKMYQVVCLGQIEEDRFEIEAPIGRDPKNRFKFAIVRDEKEASTMFEKVKETTIEETVFTSLEAFPRTGRTHQIRVHLAAYGFPIAGDIVYSSNRLRELYLSLGISRMMLHAKSLKFNLPDSTEVFITSKTPKEFDKFF